MRKEQYVVTIDRLEGITVSAMCAYIKEAVECWKGCYDPENPISDITSCTVWRQKEPKRAKS